MTKRPLAACRYVRGFLAAIIAVISALPVTAAASTSSANFDMRKQVMNLTGVLNVTGYTGQVTRGDFARILVNAPSYRENLPSSSVSVFADVPNTHPDAVYIRIAAPQRWMIGFLRGLLRPEEYTICKDAVKAALTMLGYSDGDFTGDLASSRISKFNYLELNEEMNHQLKEVLDQTDRMNLLYNLLKTKKKDSNETYGAVLDCELNSDGEINPTTILDDERKGPILVCRSFDVIQSTPFEPENTNVPLNGTASTLEAVKVSQQGAGFAAIYYNVKPKTVWAYTARGWSDDGLEGNNTYVLLKGGVKNIYYKSTNVMTPTPIRLEVDDDNSNGDLGEDGIDEDTYLTINLDSLEFQYLFSTHDGIEVGNEAVMVCNKSDSSYTAVGITEY